MEFLDDPHNEGTAIACRHEFLVEHTLERRAEAIVAAIQASRWLPGIDSSKTLLIGVSEGDIVAGRVSKLLKDVTNVASLAGGGPTAPFTVEEAVRRSGEDVETETYDCRREVKKQPDSIDKFCWGHPYRRWASFLKTSTIEELLQSPAKHYIAHGTRDQSNGIVEFDLLRAEFTLRGGEAVFDRVEGADHAFTLAGQEPPGGLIAVCKRVIDWFLPLSSLVTELSPSPKLLWLRCLTCLR